MKKIENSIKKNSKFEDLKNAEVEALSEYG